MVDFGIGSVGEEHRLGLSVLMDDSQLQRELHRIGACHRLLVTEGIASGTKIPTMNVLRHSVPRVEKYNLVTPSVISEIPEHVLRPKCAANKLSNRSIPCTHMQQKPNLHCLPHKAFVTKLCTDAL